MHVWYYTLVCVKLSYIPHGYRCPVPFNICPACPKVYDRAVSVPSSPLKQVQNNRTLAAPSRAAYEEPAWPTLGHGPSLSRSMVELPQERPGEESIEIPPKSKPSWPSLFIWAHGPHFKKEVKPAKVMMQRVVAAWQSEALPTCVFEHKK